MSSKAGTVRESSPTIRVQAGAISVAAAVVGGIGTDAVLGITFGVVIAIAAAVLAVLALIISRRRRPISSYSAHAFEEEPATIDAIDEDLSDIVSARAGSSNRETWESPMVNYEIEPEDE
jgi:hypothetical protein